MSVLSNLRVFAAGALGGAGFLMLRPIPKAECASKDKEIAIQMAKLKTKKKKTVSECTGLMLALLACYKTYNFNKGKCDGEEKALTDCTIRKAAAPMKKDTMKYHIARLMRRR